MEFEPSTIGFFGGAIIGALAVLGTTHLLKINFDNQPLYLDTPEGRVPGRMGRLYYMIIGSREEVLLG
ncbi:hypothetical protein HY407_00440 [Candidatus Gottesmanbacteria bacterium]|nr:hypothetical protein [Candidatus Gottesmanbacteria bacterium]